ncbi:BLUF domain-containing protein [Cognatiyoonia sp. IB215446]|uniref:BLUF domain-containing protein n=1 Tax=Cognatiyoonia sp. IB215446 TaxID=3097355 RepID=UPI002A1072F7|nr:BLUF domain-containing protein [Cognatiyoonia sp. IB215446]MDX8346923.1 BLUF domain-containing protein [Cognatiyoonia sp. IB215446]
MTTEAVRKDIVSRLIYTSRSLIDPDDKINQSRQLNQILRVAQARNTELAVTGGLFLKGNVFGQVLEGAPEHLDQIMQKIRQDPRHTNVTQTSREDGVQRVFGDWSMALVGDMDTPVLMVNPPESTDKNEAGWLVSPEQFDIITKIKRSVLCAA